MIPARIVAIRLIVISLVIIPIRVAETKESAQHIIRGYRIRELGIEAEVSRVWDIEIGANLDAVVVEEEE
jgi:hypothetical protein